VILDHAFFIANLYKSRGEYEKTRALWSGMLDSELKAQPRRPGL
jgi:cytochrome c-type biogenesis protein CcmH/NrfG